MAKRAAQLLYGPVLVTATTLWCDIQCAVVGPLAESETLSGFLLILHDDPTGMKKQRGARP